MVVRKLVEDGPLTTGALSTLKRELLEGRPIGKKLKKFIGLVSRGTLRDFGDALNKILDDAGYLAEDDQIPCSGPMPIEDLD